MQEFRTALTDEGLYDLTDELEATGQASITVYDSDGAAHSVTIYRGEEYPQFVETPREG